MVGRTQIGTGYWSKKDLICFTKKNANGQKKIVCFPATRGSSSGGSRKRQTTTAGSRLRTPANMSTPPSTQRRPLPAPAVTGRPQGAAKRKKKTPRRIVTAANTRIREALINSSPPAPSTTPSPPRPTPPPAVRRIQPTFIAPVSPRHISNIPTPSKGHGRAHERVQSFVRAKLKGYKKASDKKAWARNWEEEARALGYKAFRGKVSPPKERKKKKRNTTTFINDKPKSATYKVSKLRGKAKFTPRLQYKARK